MDTFLTVQTMFNKQDYILSLQIQTLYNQKKKQYQHRSVSIRYPISMHPHRVSELNLLIKSHIQHSAIHVSLPTYLKFDFHTIHRKASTPFKAKTPASQKSRKSTEINAVTSPKTGNLFIDVLTHKIISAMKRKVCLLI